MRNVIDTESIFCLLNRHRRISKLGYTEEEFNMYYNTLMQINALSKYDSEFRFTSLDKWHVNEIFAQFVMPSEITVDMNKKDLDILDRSGFEEFNVLDGLDAKEFNAIDDLIMSGFRDPANAGAKTINELRVSKRLNEVYDRGVNEDGMMVDHDGDVMPIPMTVSLVDNRYYNVSAVDEVQMMLQKQFKRVGK